VPQGRSGRQRKILHSISGVAAVTGEDGQLMPCLFAVLGPSGAGKTTFMDILSGRKRDPGKIGKTALMATLSGCKQDWGKIDKTTFMDILSGRIRDPGKIGKTTFMPTLSGCNWIWREIGILACMTNLKLASWSAWQMWEESLLA